MNILYLFIKILKKITFRQYFKNKIKLWNKIIKYIVIYLNPFVKIQTQNKI